MYYGFDIGGTKIELVAFNQHFTPVKQQRQPTPCDDYQQLIDVITNMVLDFDQQLNCKGHVGIGLPGVIDPYDHTFVAVNIPCVTGNLFDADLSAALNRSVLIENDCKCFALSEAVLGAAKNYHNVFGAIIGTGAGGGLVSAGKLQSGINGFAGEWGHIGINAYMLEKHTLPIWRCNCSLMGCAEQYASGTGLQNIYQHLLSQTAIETDLTAIDIMQRVHQKDAIGVATFDIYLDMLASCLATIQLSYDTDAIVLGGGMSNVALLYEELPTRISQHLFESAQVPKILAPEFGDSSGVRGAALLHAKSAIPAL